MRKLVADKKGRGAFIAFAAVAVAAVVGMSFFVVRAVALTSQVYDVAERTVFYDEDDRYVQTQEAGTASEQWSGDWKVKVSGSTYQLGKHAALYDQGANEVALLGDSYRVFEDGSVSKSSGRTVAPTDQPSFYKLADRYYVVVAPTIANEDGSFTADNYLIVRMDKLGNAWLANDTVNAKTVQPMKLSFDALTFDVANEKLQVMGTDGTVSSEVDLSKINGSTNEYVPGEPVVDEGESTDADGATADATGGVAGGGSTTTVIGGGSATATGGAGGSGSATSGSVAGGATSGTTGNGSGNGSSNADASKRDQITPSVTLTGASTGVSSVTFGYNVYDPEGRYASVFALISRIDDGQAQEATKVLLNAGATSKTVYGLSPNSVYRVTLGYTLYKTTEGTGGVDQTADFITVTTKAMGVSVSVPKISSGAINANVRFSSGYRLDSAELVLYSNGQEVGRTAVDVSRAAATGGWTTSFANPGTSNVELRLENAYYQGEPITLNAKCTVRNNITTTKTS